MLVIRREFSCSSGAVEITDDAVETGSSSDSEPLVKYRDVVHRISPLLKSTATRQRKRKTEGMEALTSSPYIKNQL
jgi:hypothetical protein